MGWPIALTTELTGELQSNYVEQKLEHSWILRKEDIVKSMPHFQVALKSDWELFPEL